MYNTRSTRIGKSNFQKSSTSTFYVKPKEPDVIEKEERKEPI
jgi:hypothetical protein